MLLTQILPVLIHILVIDNINVTSLSFQLISFPTQLVALLREVKYLEQQNCSERVIPDSAANVFQQNETYRKYLQNLDVTVALYNKVRETIMDVEYPLIEKQLNDIDQELEKAISQLNWTSEGIFTIAVTFLPPSYIYNIIIFIILQEHGSILNQSETWCVI